MSQSLFGVAVLLAGVQSAIGQGHSMLLTEHGVVTGAFGSAWSGFGVGPGMSFYASMKYDPSTPASPQSPGSYPGSILFASLSFGTTQFDFDLSAPGASSRIDVIFTDTVQFGTSRGYFWFVNYPASLNGMQNLILEQHLFSSATGIFSNPALNIQILPISTFDQSRSLTLSGFSGNSSQTLEMLVQDYQVSQVPEPGVAALVSVAGLASLVVRSNLRFRNRG